MRTGLGLIGGLAAAAALAGCGGPEPRASAPAAPPSGERWVVRLAPIADLKPVAATVTGKDMAEARARIGGTLVKLAVKAGDRVRRGQLIGMVADERIGLQTQGYEAQVLSAQAEASRADAELNRIRDLYQHGVYAKARLDQAEASARAANGALNAARAQHAASAESAAQGAILAPADGRVVKADVPPGSVVTMGQSIATLTAGPTVLRIELPEGDARALAVGDKEPLVSEDLGPGASEAEIVKIYPAVTGGQATADLVGPKLDDQMIGRHVRARVKVGERQALVVPRRFIVARYGVDYARVVARDNSTADVPVQLAPAPSADMVEVLSGLNPGDVLVAPGAGK